MMKTFATAAALAALAIAPAVAQGNMKNTQKPSDMPAAQTPAKPDATMKSSQDSMSKPSTAQSEPSTAAAPSRPSTGTASSTAPTTPKIVSQQTPDQWLASSFKGTDVIGPDRKKIGDVSDVLFDYDGAITAYVVGVGGFLGIGAKDVAIAPSSFEIVNGDKAGDSKKLKLSMTADELKQAESFKPYKAPAPASQTTGMSKTPGGMPPRSK